jgi:nucleosome binding factor SPN SPT16 subunit
VILRTVKPEDNTEKVIQNLLSSVKKDAAKIAIYQKDVSDGELTDKTLKAVEKRGFSKVDMKEFMDKVHMVKITPELENMGIASKFVKWTFENIIQEVEDIIEAEKKIKHSQI